MFSLNSLNTHNQILLNLGQLTSRQSGYLFKQKKNNGKASKRKAKSDILCAESLAEAVRNCDSFSLAALHNLDISQILIRGERLKNINNDTIDPFKVSYVSSNSFEENRKMGPYSEAEVLSSAIQKSARNIDLKQLENYTNYLIRSLCAPHLTRTMQVRGFKTDRSVSTEQFRNPTLMYRLRKAFGITPLKPGAGSNDLFVRNVIGSSPATGSSPRLETLLEENGAHLTTEQKNKIKVAFAEGYLTGSLPENQRGTKAGRYLRVVQQLLTIVIFLAIFVSLMASASGSVFRIQLGNQVEVDPEEISVTFDDVKGADEAKQELKDVVEFLKSPEKFSVLGGKLPKGVLLVGPPGTGKTLLARAVAGEAGVPFFHAAGPEFDEILVGQGARRVRDLFKAAKERAPCVVFIDEIDSVGAKRTNSILHPYANQTINQLLSEMDGFHQNEGVIVLGATNRRDDLDAALLRPGRFDVEVNVPTPDYSGRKEILQLYLTKVLHGEVDVELLARGTSGFTGADIENMVNQAALRAAIDGAKEVTMKYLEGARDKVLMGPERKSRIPDEEANTITAYHEGGHAIVAFYTKESHPLHKVTIIPRGPSLGHTAYIPAKERYHVTKQQLLAMMDTMMGGRAAEELIFGMDKITSGASSDLKQATSIAHHMVKEWGMSETVGLRTFEGNSKSSMFGPPPDQLSAHTIDVVDSEIKKILNDSYERAKHILKSHSKEHKALAEALMLYETLDADDIKAIMSGEKIALDKHPDKNPKHTVIVVKPDSPTAPNINLPVPNPAGQQPHQVPTPA